MNRTEILDSIALLSKSNGKYKGLLPYAQNNPEFLDRMEEQNFGDLVDMVMFLDDDFLAML